MADSLFVPLGDGRYQPTGLSRGPWSPNALHGGPTAALVAHAAETVLADSGADAHLPVRLTLISNGPCPSPRSAFTPRSCGRVARFRWPRW